MRLCCFHFLLRHRWCKLPDAVPHDPEPLNPSTVDAFDLVDVNPIHELIFMFSDEGRHRTNSVKEHPQYSFPLQLLLLRVNDEPFFDSVYWDLKFSSFPYTDNREIRFLRQRICLRQTDAHPGGEFLNAHSFFIHIQSILSINSHIRATKKHWLSDWLRLLVIGVVFIIWL